MPLFLPTRNALVDKTLMATTSMWAWMRDITAAFNNGNGFAPADATYFLRTADTDLPNARVATNSATVTLDYSTPGQVKWNASNTSPVIQGATVTLTDAQVKALPTTPVQLVAAQGANTLLYPLLVNLVSNFTAGAYTNVNADSFVYVNLTGAETSYTNFIANDSTIPLTHLSFFLSARISNVQLTSYTESEPVNDWGNLPSVNNFTTSTNQAMFLTAGNSGSGNWTGGNAANTLAATPYYIVVPV